MFQITREIDFCFGHRVLGDPRCGNLHGHNVYASLTLQSEQLDSLGMVLDFTQIKRVVSAWIDEQLDHRMILQRDDPATQRLARIGEPLYVVDQPPTFAAIGEIILKYAAEQGLPVVDCQIREHF